MRADLQAQTSVKKVSAGPRTPVRAAAATPASSRAATKSTATSARVKPARPTILSLPTPRARPVPPPPAVAEAQPRALKPVKMPAILLEGDAPAAPRLSGPGERYSLSPASAPGPVMVKDKLPEAYGSERLFLMARDPHWLYATWDLTAEQHAAHAARAKDGRLLVRCYVNEVDGKPAVEAQAFAESRSWFFHVDHAAARYVAELGYFRGDDGQWSAIAVSAATFTPPDSLSKTQSAEFATIPPDVTLNQVFAAVQSVVTENPPLAQAVLEPRHIEPATPVPPAHGPVASASPATALEPCPAPDPMETDGQRTPPSQAAEQPARTGLDPTQRWTASQREALAGIVRLDEARRVWVGSLEITELIRRHLEREISSAAASQPDAATPGEQAAMDAAGIFSPLEEKAAGPDHHRGFWFNLNVELILYGATEPDAQVRIAGRQIRLRPDGSFSCRFALPDGRYPLAVSAESGDGLETLSTRLQFSRRTEHHGPVGTHPQDPNLNAPAHPDLD